MRSLVVALVVAHVSSQGASWDATLLMHDNATADALDARCLDGTNGGFYYRPASTPAASRKWKFHFMGGGWCFTAAQCASRALGQEGSSSSWPPVLSALENNGVGFSGLMALNDTSVNPFGDWNFVWLPYCDGSSQTSDRSTPLVVNGTTLHFRGRAVLDAHLAELERRFAFQSTATEVIVSGTSAGGESAFLHASFIKSRLRAPGARLVAAPDAGYWWAHESYKNAAAHPFLDNMRAATSGALWNSTLRGALGACLAAPPYGDAARCYVHPHVYAYLDVPTFVIQSLADPANNGFCYGVPCALAGASPGTCTPAEVAALLSFGDALHANITAAQAPFGDRDGHFLTGCAQHEESCRYFDWWGIGVGGVTLNVSFAAWYAGGGAAPSARVVDAPWPNNPSCAYHDGSHGFC